jgi:hypothetical protein
MTTIAAIATTSASATTSAACSPSARTGRLPFFVFLTPAATALLLSTTSLRIVQIRVVAFRDGKYVNGKHEKLQHISFWKPPSKQ